MLTPSASPSRAFAAFFAGDGSAAMTVRFVGVSGSPFPLSFFFLVL